MELSRKNLIYRFVNLYTNPDENFCIFVRQFFLGILGILVFIAGTLGTFLFSYYNLINVSGFLYLLKFFSVLSSMIILVLFLIIVAFIFFYFLEKGKNEIGKSEFYKGLVSKMSPIKSKYDKLCCKIHFKD
jgi:hypothetical protein